MSLQIWLPLNGQLTNNGVLPIEMLNNGGTVSTNGKIGSCYYLNTTCLYNTDISINLNSFSVAYWVKFTSFPSSSDAFCVTLNTSSSSDAQFMSGIYSADGNTATFRFNLKGDCGTLSKNVWYHLATTYDGSKAYLYINGILQNTLTISVQEAHHFVIGGRSTSATGTSFNGNHAPAYYNDVRVYDTCLSAQEIKDLAKCLVAHYPLNDIINKNLLNNSDTTYWMNSNTDYSAYVTKTAYMEDGYAVVKIQRKATGGQCYYYGWYNAECSEFPLKNNTTYTISADIRSNQAGRFGFDSRPSSTGKWQVKFTNTNGKWQRFESSWTTPDAASSDTAGLALIMLVNNSSSSTSDYAEIRKCKIERSDHCSIYAPQSTEIYDTSGYNYIGTVIPANAPISASAAPRYSASAHFDAATKNIALSDKFLGSFTAGSVSFWAKINVIGASGVLPFTGQSTSYYLLASSNWTGAFYNGTVTGSPTYYIDGAVKSTPSGADGRWHHYCVTNVNLSAWTKLYLNNHGGSSSWNTPDGSYSDIRFYNTVLSADDVKELYNAPIKITKSGALITNGEIVE